MRRLILVYTGLIFHKVAFILRGTLLHSEYLYIDCFSANGLKYAFVLVQISRFQQIIDVFTLQAPTEVVKVIITNLNIPLRNQAYSNILKILPPKNENFRIKILIFFHISAQNIDCGYSLEPPQ